MTRSKRIPFCRLAGLLPVLTVACNLKVYQPSLDETSSTASAPSTGNTVQETSSSSTSTNSATTTEPPSPTSASFISGSDTSSSTGPSLPGCDVFAQDCPEGQKCAWTSYFDTEENMGCVPLAPDPQQPGEPCVYETEPMYGYPTGVDNCDKAAMCLSSGTPGEGICVGLCKGSGWAPYCDDGYTCVGGRTHWYCQRDCDPLVQDCPMGYRCSLDQQGFVFGCQIEYDVPQVGLGKPCSSEWECEPGLTCAWGETVPGCIGQGCCTKWCDLTDPAFDCGLDGQQCEVVEVDRWVQWPDHLGICLVPGGP